MGLDTVELILAVEREFQIEIANEVASQIATVGDLHECVLRELARQRAITADRTQTFEKVRGIICDQLGIDPRHVRPEAHIVFDLGAD